MIAKNDRIKLVITDMGIDGEGIGKYIDPSANGQHENGLTFFVKNAVIGDEVLAVVTKMKKGYGYAKVLEILKPSQNRVKTICPLAERCGGCQIMQLSYDVQLKFKEEKVRNNIERIGGVTCEDFQHILGMDDSRPAHFRNKMQFPVGLDKEGHVVTGFYAGRTHCIIAAPDCPVSPEVNNKILSAFRAFAQKQRISAYNEETGTGLMRHILIRNGFYTGQIMVCLVINGSEKDLDTDQLTEALTAAELPKPWKISSICLNINKKETNVILGEEVICLYGNPYIEEQIISGEKGMKPLTFRINPLSFFQTNPYQTNRLYDTALEYAELTGNEVVWDLYCGAGTISLFLAQKAGRVFGVEIVPEAIEDAKANAARNGITNAEFFCGRSEELYPAMASQKPQASVVVLDPPRKGCDRVLLDAIRAAGPDRIVYVSCDSATLARDLKILCGKEDPGSSYRLIKARPVDMFPHTTHVETVVLLSGEKVDGHVDIEVAL